MAIITGYNTSSGSSNPLDIAGGFLDDLQNKLTIGEQKGGYELNDTPVYSPDQKLSDQLLNAFKYKPENLARKSQYTDPLITNFKLMVDFSKPYGLFANEKYINSATAYIKRVFGEDSPRYTLIKKFIEQFKLFIRDYDFLILNCEGLDELYSIYNKHTYVEESEIKLNVVVQEIVTMKLAGLINLYNLIWFDNVRGVEILPANLRRFDLYVLVFNAGYFNSEYYDNIFDSSHQQLTTPDYTDGERNSFPTVLKLAKLRELINLGKVSIPNIEFNSIIFQLVDAQFDMIETGKKMFSDLSNEMNSEIVKNNLAFTARFVNLRGKFAEFAGSVDLMPLLVAADKNTSSTGNFFSNWANSALKGLKNAGTDIVNSTVGHVFDTARGLLNKTSPIGNALSMLLNPEEITDRLGNAVKVATDGLLNKYVDKPANWLQNMVQQNFRPDILTDLMHSATDDFFGVGVDQIREIENINDLAKQLPTETDIKPNDIVFTRPDDNKFENINKPIEYREKIKYESDNETVKPNIVEEDIIPTYSESDNKTNQNIIVKNVIDEYSESNNKTNIVVQNEISEYAESNNRKNLHFIKEIFKSDKPNSVNPRFRNTF